MAKIDRRTLVSVEDALVSLFMAGKVNKTTLQTWMNFMIELSDEGLFADENATVEAKVINND